MRRTKKKKAVGRGTGIWYPPPGVRNYSKAGGQTPSKIAPELVLAGKTSKNSMSSTQY